MVSFFRTNIVTRCRFLRTKDHPEDRDDILLLERQPFGKPWDCFIGRVERLKMKDLIPFHNMARSPMMVKCPLRFWSQLFTMQARKIYDT